jgi:hypothetical protein
MAHGAQDWLGATPISLVHRLDDMGELAVRLNSPYVMDRRGDVIHMTSFDGGNEGWATDSLGLASEAYPVANPVNATAMSLCLHTDAGAADYCRISRNFPFFTRGRFGFGICFSPPTGTYHIDIQVTWYEGAFSQIYITRYYAFTREIQVYNAGAWVTLLTLPILSVVNVPWYYFKLVIDLDAQTYTRVMFQEHVLDASAYAPLKPASAIMPAMHMAISLTNTQPVSKNMYLDGLVVTCNE